MNHFTSAAEFVQAWDESSPQDCDNLSAAALSLPVLRHYSWEEPTEPGWMNEVLALYIDPEDDRRVFGFANIADQDGYTGLGWEEPEDLPAEWIPGSGTLTDYDLPHDTGYFS